jgi:hypothetical protein
VRVVLGSDEVTELTAAAVADEMLDAWFATDFDPDEAANVARLEQS